MPSPMKHEERSGREANTFGDALRILTAVFPAALAAAGAHGAELAAHDDGVVRTAGAGFSGVLRALDLVVAAPALLAPFGSRAMRCGLASALVTGLCGAIAFDLARDLASAVVAVALRRFGLRTNGLSGRLASAVASVSVLTALLSPAWQAEASAPGGSVTGALLVVVALRIATARVNGPVAQREASPVPEMALVVGLAASYEPLVLVAALAALLPWSVGAYRARAKPATIDRGVAIQSACAFALGLLPLGLGFALTRRPPEMALAVPLFTVFEKATVPVSAWTFAGTEMGALLLFVCAGGAALSWWVKESWRRTLPLVLVVFVGALSILLRSPAGPSRYAATLLSAVLAAHVLGATMLAALVLAVASARVPFAEASAALVVVLELVLPVRAIDETTTRREAHAPHASAIWNDVAWGRAPPAAVLVADRRTMRRVVSARATGRMRGDLVVVPAYDVQGREGLRALVAEPKLAALYRDMALGVPPEELSLAELGAERAVLAPFDPTWDRSLSRHLVPLGLSSRFDPSPRGSSERKNALEAFAPAKAELVRITVTKKDADLAASTAALLRARAIGMAATGERDVLSQALDDLRAFAPDDPIGATLVRRIVTTKGPIDVRDLTP